MFLLSRCKYQIYLNKQFDRKFSNYFLILFFIYSMYNLKTIPIFASNYNLNIMLRVQEICKQQGITMQDLAKEWE